MDPNHPQHHPPTISTTTTTTTTLPTLSQTLSILDPVLQFWLRRKTNRMTTTTTNNNNMIPLTWIQHTLPFFFATTARKALFHQHVQTLQEYGILLLFVKNVGSSSNDDDSITHIGFFANNTGTTTQQRQQILQQRMFQSEIIIHNRTTAWDDNGQPASHTKEQDPSSSYPTQEQGARQDLQQLLFSGKNKNSIRSFSQSFSSLLAYAGTLTPTLDHNHNQQHPAVFTPVIPSKVWQAFFPDKQAQQHSSSKKNTTLYLHQQQALESILCQQQSTAICTGTGSGKSLCYQIPIVTHAFLQQQESPHPHSKSILLFPTKALAQDQYQKLQSYLSQIQSSSLDNNDSDSDRTILRAAMMDGDTPPSQRRTLVQQSHILFTNPDTLHCNISLFVGGTTTTTSLYHYKYIVLDEAHLYNNNHNGGGGGIGGAHVALILRRFQRAQQACSSRTTVVSPLFIVTSATLSSNLNVVQAQLQKLCGSRTDFRVIAQDTSPRAAQHFWLWNPPLLSDHSNDDDYDDDSQTQKPVKRQKRNHPRSSKQQPSTATSSTRKRNTATTQQRRHAADETAYLLAQALTNGTTRCIAFCKTRNLVEWVYERCLQILKKHGRADLCQRVESYRGGYRQEERRFIERKLFSGELLAVVGTNALELGVDVGGVDLTLHCGYPRSYTSLLQQAGRAGRGPDATRPSSAVVICFNSPVEQHLWRHPRSLFAKGVQSDDSIPLRGATLRAHLLCAAAERPLCGKYPVTILNKSENGRVVSDFPADSKLFCEEEDEYFKAVQALVDAKALREEKIVVNGEDVLVYSSAPSKIKPWSRVSIRSVEPINYSIVDVSHPGQNGRINGIYDENAILDTLPYSRVFYHAHPGAIITHRGQKYKIISMTQPPDYDSNFLGCRGTTNLAAFAKPTTSQYTTRPLSRMQINVINQLESAVIENNKVAADDDGTKKEKEEYIAGDSSFFTPFAGCGAVSVKRCVHGYKKLSLITRQEIARSELSLPDMEFETSGLWINTSVEALQPLLGDRYGEGVHALSHAVLAVAPLFVPGLSREDIQCDHNPWKPTHMMLFDERAGGSGCVHRLWPHFFVQDDNILDAAISLLEECSACSADEGYDGGCLACIHASECLKFNTHLSRTSGVIVGKYMKEKLEQTNIFKSVEKGAVTEEARVFSPRRKARERAMEDAKDMISSRGDSRQYVIARPSWPMDRVTFAGRQEME